MIYNGFDSKAFVTPDPNANANRKQALTDATKRMKDYLITSAEIVRDLTPSIPDDVNMDNLEEATAFLKTTSAYGMAEELFEDFGFQMEVYKTHLSETDFSILADVIEKLMAASTEVPMDPSLRVELLKSEMVFLSTDETDEELKEKLGEPIAKEYRRMLDRKAAMEAPDQLGKYHGFPRGNPGDTPIMKQVHDVDRVMTKKGG